MQGPSAGKSASCFHLLAGNLFGFVNLGGTRMPAKNSCIRESWYMLFESATSCSRSSHLRNETSLPGTTTRSSSNHPCHRSHSRTRESATFWRTNFSDPENEQRNGFQHGGMYEWSMTQFAYSYTMSNAYADFGCFAQ